MLKFILIITIVKCLIIVSGADEPSSNDSSSSSNNSTVASSSPEASSSEADDLSASTSEEQPEPSKIVKMNYFLPVMRICGPNETYSACLNNDCERQNCSELISPRTCVAKPTNFCRRGCHCNENHLRNDKGVCVPIEECPKPKCGANEVFDFCPAPCPPRRCDVDERVIKCAKPPQLGDKECNPSCRCADNYYRNDEGVCVRKSQCPKCHGKNEVYEECPRTCPPETCQNIVENRIYHCPRIPITCKGACRCKPNMFRNHIGECISREDCMKCKGPHEYFSCGSACDNECDKLSKQNQTSCPIVNITCNRKCYCEPGYARNIDNICVPFDKCPRCNANEEYVKNVKAVYRPKTCSESILGLMEYVKENATVAPQPGCVCMEGYARNHEGICIPTKDCYLDVGAIALNVKDINQTEALIITAVIAYTPTPACGANEIMSDCINGGCEKHNCTQLIAPEVCVNIPKGMCKKGCRCKDNYLRDKDGICIPIPDCPTPQCPGKDEVFEECPTTCPPQTCESLKAMYKCAPTKSCKPACRCKPNMYRNKLGECITREQCSQCKENEIYVRNMNSRQGPKTCQDSRVSYPQYSVEPIPHPIHLGPGPVIPERPRPPGLPRPVTERPGCTCIDNYVRNDQGICIPRKNCPPVCGRNEVYVNNTNAQCKAKKCSELGFPLECEVIDVMYNAPLKPGCACKEGYVRDENNVCISPDQCPSCGGDPNATRGCGIFCQTCDTLRYGPKSCPKICKRNGCQCKKNYIYDTRLSKCVLPEDCDAYSVETYYLL